MWSQFGVKVCSRIEVEQTRIIRRRIITYLIHNFVKLPSVIFQIMAHQMIGGYKLSRGIAAGAYGRVFLGTKSTADKEEFAAIKQMFAPTGMNHVVESYEKEKSILKVCDHPNIVKLLHHEEQGDLLYLVLQYCNGESLRKYIETEKSVPFEIKLLFCHDACQGLMYLHSMKILHRDLKPDNLLIHQDPYGLSLILGDVGVGRYIPDGKTNEQATLTANKGTEDWMAPEMYAETGKIKAHYNRESDVFAMGLCLAAILVHKEGEPLRPLEGIRVITKHT